MSLRWELAPYSEPWPASIKTALKSAAMFHSDWDSTLRLLADETGRLDAGLVVIEVDAFASQLTRSRQGFAVNGPPRTPGVRVCFDSKNGMQRFVTGVYSTWRANVRAVGLSLTALRAVDRYGVSRGEQYIGFRPAIEAPVRPQFENPRQAIRWMLDVLRDSGDYEGGAPDQVYKRLAKALHPDTGTPVPELWAKLQAAKELLDRVGVL